MKPEDLTHLRVPSSPTVSPDGRTACYVLTRIDLEEDAYRSQLWVVPTDGSEPPRQLTRGARDAAPRYSPDGRWIAFLRTEDDKPPQLHVMPTAGGDARRVGDHKLGAAAIAWSPDSRRIAYVARVPEEGRYGTDEDVPPGKEPARRITTRKYRIDGLGYTIDRRPHVFVVDAVDEDAEPVQVTRGDFDHGAPAWSPDGSTLAFVSARHEERDRDLASDAFVVDVAEALARGTDARQVTRTTTTVGAPAFTPDGTHLLFAGHGVPLDVVGRNTGIFRVPVDGSSDPERLTDPEAHEVSDPLAPGANDLLPDDERVVTVRLHRGSVELCAYPYDGGEPQRLLNGPRQARGYARAGDVTVAVVADDTSAGELVAIDVDGAERILTDHGATLAREVTLRPMTELETTAPDGYPVHGWVVKPAGRGPFPVLLSIHGGPFTQYGWSLFDEAQVYAGAGYAVVLGNPRGSQGYGEAHGRAIVHDMGNLDADDIMALLETALADEELDGQRVGVMGGSYGGFMTTWLSAAHPDRFRAAISERALNAWDSFAGSSDIGSFFVDLYAGDDPGRIAEQDPLRHADAIRAPMLIIHAEEDYRCPLEQAQRLFERLLRNGVDTEMLLFPGEGHELSRSGLPSHRVQRFTAILDWWSRHLG
jgi:dipeptidyl aminopeptidase/acylaminoacyl peptidase